MTRKTLFSFLDDAAARSDEIAFVNKNGLRISRWSYLKLAHTAFQFARELEKNNISKGDRVLFWAENSPEWIAAFFGCMLRGVIVVPLDVESAPNFAARVQKQVYAKLLFCSSNRYSSLDTDLFKLRSEDLIEKLAHHSSSRYQSEDIAEDDIAEIIFTSGTTAEPRGVCITHKNLLTNLAPIEREIKKYLKWEKYFHPIRFLNLLPLSHVFGQFMGIFVPQILGSELYFQDSLNPSSIIETVKKHRISVIVAVPRILDSIKSKVERDYEVRGKLGEFRKRFDASKSIHFLKRFWVFRDIHRQFGWKFWAFVSGGAALSPETESFWQRLNFAVLQGYGMTETASLISVNHPFKVGRGSIGKILPGQEMKLDENGEILVRGSNVSPGYWNGGLQPLTNEEGWLRTGDLGEMDSAGNLYFKGRKKDVIVTAAGMNIYPDDLEKALNSQPEVRESAVIGVDGRNGPEPLAVLILRDQNANPSTIVERANRSLGEYQKIRKWFLWRENDFPRTSTHKILKRSITEVVKASMIEGAAVKAGANTVVEIISKISGDKNINVDPSANLSMDLKLDSLGRVELLSALEDRYQININESAFTAATTVGDIERIITVGTQETVNTYSYPEWTQRFPATCFRAIVFYLVMLPIMRLMCSTRVVGRENLNGIEGPALFVSNHVAMVDQSLIVGALPAKFRMKFAVAMEGEKLRSWRHPQENLNLFTRLRLLVQYFLVVTLINVFPLPKKSGFRRSFAFAGETVDRGYHLLVFPEGKRTEDGNMNPFMDGIGLLASNLKIPVVPVKINGLFELKRKRKYFSKPGSVTIIFGEPVRFSNDEEPSQITRELEGRVKELG